MNTELILVGVVVVQLLIIAVGAWQANKTVPREVIDRLIDIAREATAKTPTKADDEALGLLADIYLMLAQRQEADEEPPHASPTE
jgi:hypothetical protein